MIWFSVLCLTLVALVVASLVLSIRSKPSGQADLALQTETATRQENIAITRERLSRIPAGADFEEARLELETALADDLGTPGSNTTSVQSAKDGRRSAYTLLVVVPLAALILYGALGNRTWIDQAGLPTAAEIRDHPEASLDVLLKRLQQTLKDEPDNLDGWMLAGRTYMSMGRYKDAENAYARANKLQPDNADLLTAWADASLLVNGNQFTPEIESRVSRALELNPQHVNALWIAGMGNYGKGDNSKALSYLAKLQPLLGGQPEIQQQVGLIINQLTGAAGTTNSQSDSKPAGTTNQAGVHQITATVSIAPQLMQQVTATQPVFVFARAIVGPKFPLAAARLTVADLPTTVVLDENSAMIEGQTIATFDKVEVTARVSMSGQPIARPGDLTSSSAEVSTDQDSTINLQIDKLVE